ncbi:MAG: 2-keto-3-deoxy-L-fuconate dehydrogenase [Cellvibrionaceae bacterium]|jgi:2-keto-3-deoxy-L-fuconate dehydrogenase
MTPFRLDGKVAIVTGGAKGIGEAVCRVFAQQGANVHLLDLDIENGERVAAEISATFHHCNLTDHEKVGEIFNTIFEKAGSLDLLVNNAGIAHIGTAETTMPDDLDKIYAVNIKSVYSCLHFGTTLMKKSGGGAIVNLASVASVTGITDRFAYSMSKGAVYTMTFSVAKDFIGDNIRCNMVGPGRVHTPFVDGYLQANYPGQEAEMFEALSKTQPIGRMGQPMEIAWLINYLCSEEAGFVTGSFYPIDGGFLKLNS